MFLCVKAAAPVTEATTAVTTAAEKRMVTIELMYGSTKYRCEDESIGSAGLVITTC